jgi:undecaprenyl diphosphate synthase
VPELPKHIAIIMDGNGRWASQRFLPRIAGHKAGVDATRNAVKFCIKNQIEVLSLFAFSSENWHRPSQEVGYLMDLFLTGLEREAGMLHEHHVQVRFIGDRARFSDKLTRKITEVEKLTAQNTRLILLIAVDYGGQWDICQATQRLAQQVEQGTLKATDLTPEHIASQLSFADLPDPDLFIRTSGELRISNFMLWQLAYSELYFTEVLWPDFNEIEFNRALENYAARERRFGKR